MSVTALPDEDCDEDVVDGCRETDMSAEDERAAPPTVMSGTIVPAARGRCFRWRLGAVTLDLTGREDESSCERPSPSESDCWVELGGWPDWVERREGDEEADA